MRSRATTSCLLMLVVPGLCIAQVPDKDEQSLASIQTSIEELIEPLAISNNYSGSVLIYKNGKEFFSKSYGSQDREKEIKNTAESKFFLASVSAMFTAAGVMKLVDQGKISLDDKLTKFLPDFKNGDRMTIHDLLTERTGIPRIGSQGRVNYTRLTDSEQTLDQLIGYFEDYPLSFEPGSRYEHSRSSYILLAKIIELVSQKSFGQFLDDEIFAPLEMKNSGHYSVGLKYHDVPNLARGYMYSGISELRLAQQIHWSSKTGHASIYSTAEDLSKFAKASLKKELLTEDSWQRMTSSHEGDDVGYGWFTSPQGKRTRYAMSGRSPGFSSFLAVYPEDELVIVMLSNINITVPYFTVPSIASIVFGEPYERLNLVNPPDVDAESANKFVGTFQFKDFYRPNGTVTITLRKNRLFADGGPLLPIDEGLGEPTKFIHRKYWSTLEFVGDKDGNTVELNFDQFKGRKIK